MNNIRYAVWHKSEPGFRTHEEAQAWINRQEYPEDYFVVATTDDFVPNTPVEELHDDRIRRNAIDEERKRILNKITQLLFN